jgi:benzoate/toluate 1,2-dioxygenase subunit alpha
LSALQAHLSGMLVEDHEQHVYRLHRAAFTDEDLFALEMKHIFEGNWIYLAHESQIPQVNDCMTTTIGRQPIVITRNKANFTCTFHGWTFNNSGKLLKVKDSADAGYPESFNKDCSHDLEKVPRFESYRGFLFGSLNPDVQTLSEFLGESTKVIDMIVDQSPDGLEVLRGSSTCTFDGNWKLQAENGADGDHVSSVHWNYAATTNHRKQSEAGDHIKAMDAGSWAKQGGASTRSSSATCCGGRAGPTLKTAPSTRCATNWWPAAARPVPSG